MGNKVAFIFALIFLFACTIDYNQMLRQSLEVNNLEMASLAVRDGADINYRDEQGMTLLHHESVKADWRNIHFLLRNGADPNIKDNFGNTPIFLLLSRQSSDSLDIYNSADILLANGANATLRYRNGTTILHRAANLGFADLCEILLTLNYISVDVEDDLGNTPLDIVSTRIAGVEESLDSQIAQQEKLRLENLLKKLEKTATIIKKNYNN